MEIPTKHRITLSFPRSRRRFNVLKMQDFDPAQI